MKNRFLYLFLAIFTLFFISCSNVFESSDSLPGNGKKARISFTLSENARTMKPVFVNGDFVKLELIAYKKESTNSFAENPDILGEWSSDSTGDCITKLYSEELELLEGVYKFCLYAYTEENGFIFCGTTEQEIVSEHINQVSFTLKPYGANSTPSVARNNWGHLNLKFYIPGNIKCVTAGMFYGSEDFFLFGSPLIVGSPTDVDGDDIYIGDDAYYYEQIELEIKNDKKGKYVEYSDTLDEYLFINDGKSGLPNGTYGIWVRCFLDDVGYVETWATEYRELIWIANGKTTTAERTIQSKYDGFALFYVEGAKPGLAIPCGYTNGTPLDESLIPQEYRPLGAHFTGWKEVVQNAVTGDFDLIPVPSGAVLNENSMGKEYVAEYSLSIKIPKFKGNDGLQDTILTTWDYYTDLDFMPLIVDWKDFNHSASLKFFDYEDEEHLTASFILDEDWREETDTHLVAVFTDYGDIGSQTQKNNNDISSIIGTDELWASFYTSNDSVYEFKHARSAVKFNFTGLPVDKKFRTMVLYTPGEYIPDYADEPIFNNDGSFYLEPQVPDGNRAEDTHLYLTLYNENEDEPDFQSGKILNPMTEGFYPENDGTLTLYTMFLPEDYTGKTLICTVIDEDENYYVAYLDGKNLQAGNIYQYTASPKLIEKEVIFMSSTHGKDIAVKTVNKGAYSPEDTGSYFTFANTGYSTSIDLAYWKTLCEDSKVTWTWGTSHGVKGFTVSGENNYGEPVSVFIPAGGYKTEPYKMAGNTPTYNRAEEYGTSLNLWTNLSFTPETGTNYGYAVYGTQEDPGVLSYFDKSLYYNVRLVDYAN